ncbi:RHS repeat-associated core domain-containing protein [Flavobacterium psychrophilum]|nr:RHS repeat-associated core domain-containing protein [Flavobacterium psychrophilum]
MFEEHSSSFKSPYLFNGKELDRETNLSFYGARYLDMKTSLWLNVDPLAEKMPSWSSYSFCFNNPMKFVDPDGRAPDDWINWTASNGQQHITYDSSIKTKEQAEAKGYTGVKQVFEAGTGRSASTGEVINFKADGNYSINGGKAVDVDDQSYTTKGGSFISENKGTVDAFGDFGPGALQNAGDATTLAAVPVSATGVGAPLGAAMATIGGTASVIGTGLELVNDAFEGNFSFAKFVRKATIETISRKLGGSSAFGPTEQIINDNIFNIGDKALDELDK